MNVTELKGAARQAKSKIMAARTDAADDEVTQAQAKAEQTAGKARCPAGGARTSMCDKNHILFPPLK